MPDRTRPIRKEICLNEQELSLIRHKMNQLGTRNFGAYARKMLINGYIIKVDYTEQKKLAAAVSRIATNINHVCFGHVQCDSIIMDEAHIQSIPAIVANCTEAQLIHEAAIGKIAGDQLLKLETLGLTPEEAEECILKGFLA